MAMRRAGSGAFVLLLLASGCSASSADLTCEALVGPEPWLILRTEDYGAECVSVGVHQDLQIWNKGTETLSLRWQGTDLDVSSDDKYETGPIGDSFNPGSYSIESSPYRSPEVHVVAPKDSFTRRPKWQCPASERSSWG